MILHRVSFRSKKYRATVFWVRKFVCQRGFDSKLGIGQSWVKTYCTCNISDINLTFYNVLFVCVFFFQVFLFFLWCENIQASEDMKVNLTCDLQSRRTAKQNYFLIFAKEDSLAETSKTDLCIFTQGDYYLICTESHKIDIPTHHYNLYFEWITTAFSQSQTGPGKKEEEARRGSSQWIPCP